MSLRTALKMFLKRKYRKLACLFRIVPFSRKFGFDYGSPIDRFYIEKFLSEHCDLIHGDVLEIAENTYTLQFGRDVVKSHILHVTEGNENATLIGNLETGENIPDNAYDCMLLTQTLPFIYDIRSVLKNCHKALKTDGKLILTVPMLSPVSRYDADRWGDYWRFTEQGVTRLLEDFFEKEKTSVSCYGNYYAASAFLRGLPLEEVRKSRLFPTDPDYIVTIGIVAEK